MTITQKFSENNTLVIEQESFNSNGEIEITAKWNGAEISQTLPVRPDGPAQLCFDKETFNFYWQRLVLEDVRNEFEVVRTYGA